MDYKEVLPLTGNLVPVSQPSSAEALDLGLPRFASVEDMVKALRPAQPMHCLHPEALAQNARLFLDHFPGTTFYAVKVNPDPYILQHLYAAGVRSFDVASLAEIDTVRNLFPTARMAFMHPVKSREAIRAAYFEYGIRDFAVDTFEELHKILEETKTAVDLRIHVRLGLPKGSALHELSAKFGATPEAAASLLQNAYKVTKKVGLCFHVGSQTMSPQSYVDAITLAGEVIRKAGVKLEVLDVGGGFPASYPGMEHPPLTEFFDAIRQTIATLKLPKNCQIWGEPGRAIVAAAGTVVVRVEMRKGDALYINDGSYGSLFDARWMKWVYPVQLVRPSRRTRKEKSLQAFSFYGPTCDSVDAMPGPFMLPDDICEGDWIAISQHGAYGASIQTRFNGFYSDQQVEITSEAPPVKRRSRKPTMTSAPISVVREQ
ncbi:MAG: type III PLP-dependent enzyme [Alphaproteobacteria bacterium]|nr:type III PLP-dependent enzyme [Alphaproteobacteria bacterium]